MAENLIDFVQDFLQGDDDNCKHVSSYGFQSNIDLVGRHMYKKTVSDNRLTVW